jgi:large subunit ribosomal protein L9
MELILKEDVENLGFKDDVVKVKNGYGRNFLIPNGLAMLNNRFLFIIKRQLKKKTPKTRGLLIRPNNIDENTLKNLKIKKNLTNTERKTT